MIKLRSDMFEESKKSTASEKIIVNIAVFIAIFILIMVMESLIPTIMSNGELTRRAKEAGVTGDFAKMYELSTALLSEPKYFTASLFCTGFGTLISIIHCRFMEARHLSSMGVRRKKAGIHYLEGLGIGIIMMTAIVLISAVFGISEIKMCSDINFGLIGIYFAGFLIQGMSEEFIFRGYFMTTLGARHDPYLAVVISAAAFSLAHLGNPGFTPFVFFNLTLFGVFAGLYMIAFNDIWGACAIHSIWNFTQGCFYGISVSGTSETESVFRTSALSTSTLLTGGKFGIEGSIVTTIVLLAGIVLVVMKIKKDSSVSAEVSAEAEKK